MTVPSRKSGRVPTLRERKSGLQIRKNQVGQFFFVVAVGTQGDIVVPRVVTAYAGIAGHIVLAGLVNLPDDGNRFFLGQILFLDDPVHAIRKGRGNEDVHLVGMILENEEAQAAGNHTGAHLGKAFQDFHLRLENIVRSDADVEVPRITRVQAQRTGRRHRGHATDNIVQPVPLLPFQVLDTVRTQAELLFQRGEQLQMEMCQALR